MAGKPWWMVALILGAGALADGDDQGTSPVFSVRQAPRILSPKERNIGRYVTDVEFEDTEGKSHRLSEWAKRKGVVVAVTSTSCPLSKKYLPTLIRLAEKYSTEGFGVLLVNPTATDSPQTVQGAVAALGGHGVYVHDRKGTLRRALQLTSTTDALLIDPARTVRYQGAVDDQYGFGYSLAAPRKEYLVTAINEYLRGEPIAIAATEAPGCQLEQETASQTPGEATYHNRISRIVQSHCAECHREGGVAPFSLESRDDLVAHGAMIAKVVQQGTMPPWFAAEGPEGTPTPWLNESSLSSADKRDLLKWLKSDRPEGDPSDAPLPIRFATGWTIGEPDLVVKFPSPVPVQATGVMSYKNVVVDSGVTEDKWVERIEIRPGAPEVVHHILVFVRPPQETSAGGRGSPEDGISYWGIYVPGNSKQVYPRGFARKLPKGSQIRFQMHYTPNGQPTEDLTQIGFVFADREPEHEVRTASLVNASFEIPPGADQHTDFAKIRLPTDITVLGFLPHMHLRGKACRYEAVTSDGQRETLLDVPRYDFNWQLMYRYAEPRTFKQGTTLKFSATFDNSAGNPANPDPQATVRWGEQTYDEMLLGYIEYYVPAGQEGEQASDKAGNRPGLAVDRDQMLFSSLDANDDDKLSLEELKKLSANPRMKLNPLTIGLFFSKLDQDQDQSLSLDEFRQIRELFRKKN